ncbi:MAG TPA: hypothetical protein VEY11_19240 [Pyrinomonadaceae bacterium]|nr:hypothetical protein [Pyrinomonadaceae bacterium]
MKLKIFIVIVAVVLAWIAGRSVKTGGESIVRSVQHEAQGGGHEGDSVAGDAAQPGGAAHGSERRINESYQLADGAQVNIHGINGPVTIEAVEGNTAEVRITSTAKRPSDLDDNQIIVEHTESSLVVRGKGGDNWGVWKWLRGGGGGVRHNVVLKLPRNVELALSGTNGKVGIGEMEGSVQISGVNGQVEIGRAAGGTEVSGVNGGVKLTVTELETKGLSVNGINGNVEIRLGGGVNADLDFNGVNGHMTIEAPNVEVREQKRNLLRARIGKGGADIEANGINGGVRVVGV